MLAAHSWPMNSSGVSGAQQQQDRGGAVGGEIDLMVQPLAERAVADLVVVLQADDEALAARFRPDRCRAARPRCAEYWPQ